MTSGEDNAPSEMEKDDGKAVGICPHCLPGDHEELSTSCHPDVNLRL
jgi:hypothetical protein